MGQTSSRVLQTKHKIALGAVCSATIGIGASAWLVNRYYGRRSAILMAMATSSLLFYCLYVTRRRVQQGIPAAWTEALNSVQNVLATLDEHTPFSALRYPTLLNLYVLSFVDADRKLMFFEADRIETLGAADIERARHFWLFTAASYGQTALVLFSLASAFPAYPPREFVAKYCGLDSAAQVLMFEEGTDEDELHAAFLLVVDHRSRSVVLTVRGTLSMHDTMVDLACEPAPFLRGLAHKGMAYGAENILRKAWPTLQSALADYPGYTLVLCGHSMGGGVAILMSLLLSDRSRPYHVDSERIEVHAFGPPPVYTPSAKLEGVEERITSWVCGFDLVPRLSVATVSRLNARIHMVDRMPMTLIERMQLAGDEPLVATRRVKQMLEENIDLEIGGEPGVAFEELEILGRCVWLPPPNVADTVLPRRVYDDVYVRDLLLTKSLIVDHVPLSYAESLRKSALLLQSQASTLTR